MIGPVTVIDRREQYYGRIGHAIASDALGFYCRAETGRAWQQLFVARAFPSPRELVLRDAPDYDPGEPEPDQFAGTYDELTHGA